MTTIGILQILIFFGLIMAFTKPAGLFMSKVFQGERTFLHPVLRPMEVLVYKICRIREDEEQGWMQYAGSVLAFSLFAFLFPYALMRFQGWLPLNPQGFGADKVSPDQAFNTAMSFMTNTNWQWYSGEAAMSYLVQMAALAVQNFVSAAVGAAVAVALIRGFARHETDKIGNFWVDMTRATLYVLLPLSLVSALLLVSQGARRRVLQRQLGASVREPDRVCEPRPHAADLRARGRLHVHVRAHGQGHATGVGPLLGDGGDVLHGRVRRISIRASRQPDDGAARDRERTERGACGRQHGGEGDTLRHPHVRAVRDGHD
jgi:K+-transporting ATPase A subunit